MSERELHGFAADKRLCALAHHEAGHLLMLWLLDRYALARGIVDGCGITKALDEPGVNETLYQHILHTLSGMILSGDWATFHALWLHAADPSYFDPMSDSHHVAKALVYLDADPTMVLSMYADVTLRLGNRFCKAHNQAARLLRARGAISFDTIHGMFCRWDEDYGLTVRPKSDVVCRAIAKEYRRRMPRERFIGWDFKPLPEGYAAPERMGLMALAKRVALRQ